MWCATLKELGATQEMLPKIANTCILGGCYKKGYF